MPMVIMVSMVICSMAIDAPSADIFLDVMKEFVEISYVPLNSFAPRVVMHQFMNVISNGVHLVRFPIGFFIVGITTITMVHFPTGFAGEIADFQCKFVNMAVGPKLLANAYIWNPYRNQDKYRYLPHSIHDTHPPYRLA